MSNASVTKSKSDVSVRSLNSTKLCTDYYIGCISPAQAERNCTGHRTFRLYYRIPQFDVDDEEADAFPVPPEPLYIVYRTPDGKYRFVFFSSKNKYFKNQSNRGFISFYYSHIQVLEEPGTGYVYADVANEPKFCSLPQLVTFYVSPFQASFSVLMTLFPTGNLRLIQQRFRAVSG